MFRYYSVARPVMPGSYPKPEKNEILCIQSFDSRTYVAEIHRPAWGYIDYEKPLGHFDVTDYELVAVKTKTLHLQYLGEDSWGRFVYKDEHGKLWKQTDCCTPREVCEERKYPLYSSAGNKYEGEPDCYMAAHIDLIFI